jgi:hypothetical protein
MSDARDTGPAHHSTCPIVQPSAAEARPPKCRCPRAPEFAAHVWQMRLSGLRAILLGRPPAATEARMRAIIQELEFIAEAFAPKPEPGEHEDAVQLVLDEVCEEMPQLVESRR